MTTDPLVTAALDLLGLFYVDTRRDAAILLSAWVHYHQLTPDQVREILDHYPSRGRPPMPPTEGGNGT